METSVTSERRQNGRIAKTRGRSPRRTALVLTAAGLLALAIGVNLGLFQPPSFHVAHLTRPVESAPLCPWREPESDMRTFFPGATSYHTEIRILSSHWVELSKRLGRPPTGEDLALYIYRVIGKSRYLGSILVRRVKGEFGAIEIVVAVGPDGTVRGVRLQRLREPDEIARVLTSPAWLSSFAGKCEDSEWDTAGTNLIPAARRSAAAIVDGVRNSLVLFDVAKSAPMHIHHHSNV